MAKKEVVIIGIGRFAKELIVNLNKRSGYSIIAIDKSEDKLESPMFANVKLKIPGDATNKEFLENLGIDNADFFVVGMGQDFKSSLIIASILKENFKGKVIAKSVDDQHAEILRKIGVDEIITPEIVAAKAVYRKIINPLSFESNADNYQLLSIYKGVSTIGMRPLKEYCNKRIREINLPKRISIALIFKNGEKPEIVNGDTFIEENDILTFIGEEDDLIKMISNIREEKLKEDKN